MEYALTAINKPIKPRSKAKVIIATSLGNGLEMFDFTVFSFFAVTIGTLFFPSYTPYGSLLMAVGVFAAGFLMRPLGSIIIGAYADRAGRKSALLLTIVLMGAGTAIIAFSPTYAQIGILAPISILLGRLLQGFAAGGEIGAATTLLLESAMPHNRGFYVSWQLVSQGLSSLLGAASGTLLTFFLSPESLMSWGWRLPFLFGLLIIPVGLYIRRKVDETYAFNESNQDILHQPVKRFFKEHLRIFFFGTGILMACSVMMYLILFYMPTFMTKMMNYPAGFSYLINVVSSLILIASALMGGMMADRFHNHRKILGIFFALALILTLPTFSFLTQVDQLWLALLFRMLIVITVGVNTTIAILVVIEALPIDIRATGTAVTYAMAVTCFGGTAQFIVTWLIEVSNNLLAPAWYLMVILLLGLVSTFFFPARFNHNS